MDDDPLLDPSAPRGQSAASARCGRALAAFALAMAAILIGGAILAVALGERARVSEAAQPGGGAEGRTLRRPSGPTQLAAGPGARKGASVVLVTIPDAGAGRRGHALLVWSGKARGGDADADGRLHALDVGSGSWTLQGAATSTSPRPAARWKSVSASTGDGFVVFSGDAEGADGTDAYMNDLWTWRGAGWVNATARAGLVPPPRRAAAGAVVDGRLVVHGGRHPHKKEGLLDDVWEADLGGGGEWRQLWPRPCAAADAPTPAARKGHAAAALPAGALGKGSKPALFIYGGRNDSSGGCYFDDAAAFVPADRAWTPLPARGRAPPPRDHAAAFYTPSSNAVYVFGGRGGPSYESAAALGDLWSFSLTARAWTHHPRPKLAPWPAPRFMFGLDAAPDGGEGGGDGRRHVVAVLFGGQDGAGARLGDAWAFSTRTGAWAPVTRGAVGAGRV